MKMNRLRADLVLLLVAFIWGSAFVVQRVAAQHFDAFTFNGLRFLLGGLILLPFSRLNPAYRTSQLGLATHPIALKHTRDHILDRKSFVFVLLAGGILFGAAGLQQAGLETTTAGNAGFITTLYVVLVPILLVIFWREKIHWSSWLGAGIAILGSLLLSTGGRLSLAKGDALEMAGAVFWALHVILVSRAVKYMDVLTFSAGQYIFAGLFNLVASLGMQTQLEGLASAWWTIVYIGILSTAIGYTLQVLGQKYAPPTDTTILLSMEAVFAAFIGYIFLNENLKIVQLFGCAMILCAAIFTQLKTTRLNSTAL